MGKPTGTLPLGALALLTAWGCDSGAKLPEHAGAKNVEAVVGRDGAELTLESGVHVTIVRDALPEDVRLEVRETTLASLPPAREDQDFETPISMTPHRTMFSREVTVEMPLRERPPESEGRQLRVLRLDDDEDTQWERVPGELDERQDRVSFRTRSFSYYAVVWEAASVDDLPDAGSSEAGETRETLGFPCETDENCNAGEFCFLENTTQPVCAYPCASDNDCPVGLCYAEYSVCVSAQDCAANCPEPGVCDARNLCTQPSGSLR